MSHGDANGREFERAQRVIPGGVNSPVRAFRSVGGAPRFLVAASGPYVTDVDGREYVDLVASWGPAILGHAYPEVVAAVQDAAARGLSFGASTPAEEGSPASRVLVPRGNLAAPTLATGLRARGWSVDEIVAYRTVPGPAPDDVTRADWTEGRIGAVVLTSGSSARNLVELLGPPPHGTLVVCLGPSTADVAARIGLDVATVATEQTPTGLVAALVDALAATHPPRQR